MKHLLIAVIAFLFLADVSCDSRKTEAPSSPAANAAKAMTVEIPTTGVRTITLPSMQTNLPPGPGVATVTSTCTLCHSQRYVLMQPNFSRKTWIAEVDKMKKVYGAPIQEEQIDPIVNYLVSIRGNGQ